MGVFGRCLLRVLPAMLAAAMGLLIPATFVHAEDDEWAMEIPEPGPETPLSEQEQEQALAVIREVLTAREERIKSFEARWRERFSESRGRRTDNGDAVHSATLVEFPEFASSLAVDGKRYRTVFPSFSQSPSREGPVRTTMAFDGTSFRTLVSDLDSNRPRGSETAQHDAYLTWLDARTVVLMNIRIREFLSRSNWPPLTLKDYDVSHGACHGSPCYVLRLPGGTEDCPSSTRHWFDLESLNLQRIESESRHVDGVVRTISIIHAWYGAHTADGVPDAWRSINYDSDAIVRDVRVRLESFAVNPPAERDAFSINFPVGTSLRVRRTGEPSAFYLVEADGGRRLKSLGGVAPKRAVSRGQWWAWVCGIALAVAVASPVVWRRIVR